MTNPSWEMLWHYTLVFNDSVSYTDNGPQIRRSTIYGIELDDNEIMMDLEKYNKIFGTEYTSSNIDDFVPHTVNIKHYKHFAPEEESILFSMDIKIVGLFAKGVNKLAGTMITGDAVYDAFAKDYFYTTGLLFEGNETIDACFDVAERLNFKQRIGVVDGIHSMTTAVKVFIPIFEFISIFLYIGFIFILMNFASKMIGDKMHEIGILKALGTKNSSIGVVFGLQVMLIALLTCGLSTLGYYLFIDVANDILIESVKRLAPSWPMLELQFLDLEPFIALMNCLLIFALAFVSLIFPMIKIKAIKPVKIIKAKE
ncbi:MAG: ABC transporter permease [Clostridia bacterium]|nr:ABC transporter permease [Clostridia bacterium]